MREFTITQTNPPPGLIDLGMGNPDLNLLPVEKIRRSVETYFSSGDPRPLQYGAERGNGYFRAALADFLSQSLSTTLHNNQFFITSGASSALDLLCTNYTRPGDVVFVEEPTYFLALRVFQEHGLRTVPIAIDNNGLRLDKLEEALNVHTPKFLYSIPTFQNPSGRTLTQERREKIVEKAVRQNFFLVADEVYHLLSYTQTPPPPLASFTHEVEQVISINSFSKILAPGLRLGWIQAHEKVIQRLAGSGLLDSGGGMNPFTSALLLGLVESGGLMENITHLQKVYGQRRKAMDAALQQYLPQAEYASPQGGFFFWIHLPEVDTSTLRPQAKKFKVDFRPGALFSSSRGMRSHIRLCFCYYKPDEIQEGVKRLGFCLQQ